MRLQFRDRQRADALVEVIHRLAPRAPTKLVHVCGTHEITITHYGLRSLLPPQLEVLEGPGCPVCVTPVGDIDGAIELAEAGHTVATFGDMVRVPGSTWSLEDARGEGGDVRIVYSAADAAELARQLDKEVVFFAVGFETTAPTVAAVLLEGAESLPDNFSLLVSHKLIPPAMEALLADGRADIQGYIAPGHVSTIIGVRPYEALPRKYGIPIVIGGFEPLDILYAIALLLKGLREEARVDNGYPRSVTYQGNQWAQELIERAFEPTDVRWRGIGIIPNSGLRLREEFARWDARRKFGIRVRSAEELHPGCRCSLVITARATPDRCPLFSHVCTPRTPYGPCMVGEEAMCNIWYRYGGPTRSLLDREDSKAAP